MGNACCSEAPQPRRRRRPYPPDDDDDDLLVRNRSYVLTRGVDFPMHPAEASAGPASQTPATPRPRVRDRAELPSPTGSEIVLRTKADTAGDGRLRSLRKVREEREAVEEAARLKREKEKRFIFATQQAARVFQATWKEYKRQKEEEAKKAAKAAAKAKK